MCYVFIPKTHGLPQTAMRGRRRKQISISRAFFVYDGLRRYSSRNGSIHEGSRIMGGALDYEL